jgi:hypothetical protein
MNEVIRLCTNICLYFPHACNKYVQYRWPRGLKRRSWPLGYWDRGFESRSRHGCLSLCFCVKLPCVGGGLCDELIIITEDSYCMSKISLRNLKKRPFVPQWELKALRKIRAEIHIQYLHFYKCPTDLMRNIEASEHEASSRAPWTGHQGRHIENFPAVTRNDATTYK